MSVSPAIAEEASITIAPVAFDASMVSPPDPTPLPERMVPIPPRSVILLRPPVRETRSISVRPEESPAVVPAVLKRMVSVPPPPFTTAPPSPVVPPLRMTRSSPLPPTRLSPPLSSEEFSVMLVVSPLASKVLGPVPRMTFLNELPELSFTLFPVVRESTSTSEKLALTRLPVWLPERMLSVSVPRPPTMLVAAMSLLTWRRSLPFPPMSVLPAALALTVFSPMMAPVDFEASIQEPPSELVYIVTLPAEEEVRVERIAFPEMPERSREAWLVITVLELPEPALSVSVLP